VDDDKFALSYLKIVLEKFKRELLIAKTGTDAVEICRKQPDIDLVLMDIKIPGIDGYEATRQIRQFNKDVFIISQTAYAQSGDREKSIEAGCNDYISKPINKEELATIILKHF
jgi:CheY-like chemotaxis protein